MRARAARRSQHALDLTQRSPRTADAAGHESHPSGSRPTRASAESNSANQTSGIDEEDHSVRPLPAARLVASARTSLPSASALQRADSAHGEHEGSNAELEASRASHVSECCKHESSRRASGSRAAGIGQSRQRRSRAARPLWSGSGGRGGVSDLGGGGQLIAEASAALTSGSRSARTRNVALCARRPRDARWNKSD